MLFGSFELGWFDGLLSVLLGGVALYKCCAMPALAALLIVLNG
jgi:hypothetical protein